MNLNIFNKEEKQSENFMYTEEQLMARLKFFIGICLALTLFGIVFVVLYSLIFVTQPMNGMSPVDNKFFELIIPIATFLTGTLSGIMLAGGDKDAQKIALQAATRPTTVSSAPTTRSLGTNLISEKHTERPCKSITYLILVQFPQFSKNFSKISSNSYKIFSKSPEKSEI